MITRTITRFSTAGDVDNGKSTLIGRLLLDQGAIPDDQLRELSLAGGGGGKINLAHITDGLKEERERGITIDVAYRYFSRGSRDFIVADTPGHREFTANMFTGTSTSGAAVVLIDAEKGIVQQNRRHLYISALLDVAHVFICVNKMDLLGYSAERFQALERELKEVIRPLKLRHAEIIPISALAGDNVVESSGRMPWYDGPPLVRHLELAGEDGHDAVGADFRFVVQLVRAAVESGSRANEIVGQVVSGAVTRGDEVALLPSGATSEVTRIRGLGGELEQAAFPRVTSLTLQREFGIRRGEVLAHPLREPTVVQRFEAHLCWMDETPLIRGREYLLKIGARTVPAAVGEIAHRVNIDTYGAEELRGPIEQNDILRVSIHAGERLALDDYKTSRRTGSFILVDPITKRTAAAGIVLRPD